MDKELRYLSIQDIEIRNKDDTDNITVAGYVVKFEERSRLLYGEFYEKVSKGAFERSLNEKVIKALWDHNTNIVLGSTKSKTLRIKEDDIGLHFELDMPKTTAGIDAYESIKRGDVDGVSFGFNVKEDSWRELDDGKYERTLIDVDLIEISPTPFPAYETSEVGKRTLNSIKNKEKDKIDLKIRLLKL